MSQHGATDPQLLEQKLAHYRDRQASHIKLGLTDVDGVIRGKYVSLEKFASILRKNGGFCDCVLGWDVSDQLYASAQFTGWHTGFPDAGFRLLVDSERWLEDEGCPYFIGEFVTADGDPHPLCPRSVLANTVRTLHDMGFTAQAGLEYEFFVFEETPHSVRDKHYVNLKPLTPGNFGYSVLRTEGQGELFQGLLRHCEHLQLPIEGLHCETGPGVWEAALAASTALEAADRAALFKTFCKGYFTKQSRMATFMAKWSMDCPGQSGHCHVSLLDAAGNNIFFDGGAPQNMHRLQHYAVGGVCRYLPQFLALIAPTVNSYARLVKGAWAPTAATWGVENRTTAVRVIPGSAASQRIEVRAPGADANPYLVLAAVLAACTLGLKEQIEPPDPVSGNAYDGAEQLPPEQRFAADLAAAAQSLDASKAARTCFGDAFVDHFCMSRRWEHEQYMRQVTDWQLDRYFEII